MDRYEFRTEPVQRENGNKPGNGPDCAVYPKKPRPGNLIAAEHIKNGDVGTEQLDEIKTHRERENRQR